MCDGMSEGEYQAMTEMVLEPIRIQPTRKIWVTKSGHPIPVARMEDQHLYNTIRFLRRNCVKLQLAEISRMSLYASKAPDAAAEAIAIEVDHIVDMTDDEYLMDRIPTFEEMLKEAGRRRIVA